MVEKNISSDARTIRDRKVDHLRICIEEDVDATDNFLDYLELVHNPLPEIDFNSIDVSTTFLGKKLKAPIMIAGMTGGCLQGKNINDNLAEAAAGYGIGFGVGSQRSDLEIEKSEDSNKIEKGYSKIRSMNIPLVMGNIGLPQLLLSYRNGGKEKALEMIRACQELIGSDFVCIHLNYLQETVQPEGELIGKNGMKVIEILSKKSPIIVKETGGGMGPKIFAMLKQTEVVAVDVGGRGGTTFSGVEYYRGFDEKKSSVPRLGELLWDWGIPTPVSVMAGAGSKPLIATGGVRNGMDIYKLLSMGADLVGLGKILLPSALGGSEAVGKELDEMIHELKTIMFLTGCTNISEISLKAKKIYYSPLSDWMEQLNIKT